MNRKIYLATNDPFFYVLLESNEAATVVEFASMAFPLSRFVNTLKREAIVDAREAIRRWNDIAWIGGEAELTLDETAMYID